ncbi:MAG: leucine-rich repeat domain-containing protein [Clostridia bacterium]|nr:leucine-rich repeat domain-containing protein [Clostridia bacterium]
MSYGFRVCYSLDYGYFNAQKAEANGVVFGSTGSADAEIQLVIGKDVQYINSYVFYTFTCSGGISITFEEGSRLREIASNAFYDCSIAAITIPATVSYIGQESFSDCSVTADTFKLENPYDWRTFNSRDSIYSDILDPDAAASEIYAIVSGKQSSRNSPIYGYAYTEEVLRGFVDETSTIENFSVSVRWYERYDWTATINGQPYSNGQLITEPGEYAITMTNSTATDTLTYTIHIQDEIITPATCTTAGLEQYLVSYTVNDETYDLDPVDIVLPATGHSYTTDPAWTWTQSGTTYTATASFLCDEGDYADVQDASVSVTDNGTTYIGTVSFNGSIYTGTYHVHSYSYTSFSWSSDYSTCTVTLTCAGSSSDACTTKTITDAAVVTTETTKPTCDESGEIIYTATYNGAVIATASETLEPVGHVYGDPSWSWSNTDGVFSATAFFKCVEGDDVIKVVSGNVTYDSANQTYTATVTFDGQTYTDSYDHAHIYKEDWEWTATADGYDATLTLTCQEGDETVTHTVTATVSAYKAETCTEDGYITYLSEYGAYKDVRTDTLEQTGHSWSSVYTDATCTAAGYTTYTCANCGETHDVVDENAPALGHDYDYANAEWIWYEYTQAFVLIDCTRCDSYIGGLATPTAEQVKATCTSDGSTTYTAAYTYTDADGNEQSISDIIVVVIPATGHYYDNAVWSWAEDGSSASVTLTCENCNETLTQDATVYATDNGTTFRGVATAQQGEDTATFRDTHHVHAYAISGTEWTAAEEDQDGGYTCTVTYTCTGSYCEDTDEHSYTVQATATSETTAASCTEDGATVYTAAIDGETVDTYTVVIPATGHAYSTTPVWSWTKTGDASYAATATFFCVEGDYELKLEADIEERTENDATYFYASVTGPDGATYTEETKQGHRYNVEWEWTATENGYSVRIILTCVFCGNVFPYEAEVELVDHRDAACEVTGYTVYKATYHLDASDETVETDYTDYHTDWVEAIQHEYRAVITDPTCTEQGYATFTCDICGDTFIDDYTPATGHSYDYTGAEWIWNGYSSAYAVITCSVCGDEIVTDQIDSVAVVSAAPGCETTGITIHTVTYEYNEYLGKSISSSQEETTAALGHTYDEEPAWIWSEDNRSATALFSCSVCGNTVDVDAHVEVGYSGTTYMAMAYFGDNEYMNIVHVHIYAITDTTWSEDHTTCTIKVDCIGSGFCSLEQQTYECTVAIDDHPATCLEDGYTIYTATYGEYTIDVQTIAGDSKTGHTYSSEPSWSWEITTDSVTATAYFTCDAGDDIQSVTDNNPTFDQEAGGYTASVTFNSQTYTDIEGHVHMYNASWAWNASEDGYTATLTLTCINGYETHTYTVEAVVTAYKAPACAEEGVDDSGKGYIVYRATFGDYYDVRKDTLDALTHNYIETVIAPTCTEEGYTLHVCEYCGASYTTDTTPATGHEYTSNSIEWIWAGTSAAELIITCDTCGDTAVREYVVSSDELTTSPDCTNTGLKTFTVTYEYSDENGDTHTISDTTTEVIPATGHSYEAADVWTWTEDTVNGGYTASLIFTCSVCQDSQTVDAEVTLGAHDYTYYATLTGPDGNEYTDAYHVHSYTLTHAEWGEDDEGNITCEVVFVCSSAYCGYKTYTATATVSSEVTVEATCTQPGTIVYTATYNSMDVGRHPVEIPATGHSYGAPVWSWTKAEDGTYSAVAIFVCEAGDDEIIIEADISSESDTGSVIYTATVTGPDGETYTDTTSHEHLYNITWSWAEDYSSASVTVACVDGDDSNTYTATVSQTAHVAAGCETDGYTTYEATYTVGEGDDAVTYSDVQTIMIAPHGHSYDATVVDPTCVVEGYTLNVCRLCGSMYKSDFVEATGEHEIDEDSIDWEWVLNADGTYSAYAVFTCVADASVAHTVEYSALVVSDVQQAETCGDDGIMVWTASYGYHASYIQTAIPATGLHTGTLTILGIDESAKTVAATCLCSVCGQDYIDQCCIVVTDYYGNDYTITFVNGVASYASVQYPASISIIDNNGAQIGTAQITPVEPEEPATPVEPEEPATPEEETRKGLAGWAIALIVIACVLVVAAVVVAVVMVLRKKKKAAKANSDTAASNDDSPDKKE